MRSRDEVISHIEEVKRQMVNLRSDIKKSNAIIDNRREMIESRRLILNDLNQELSDLEFIRFCNTPCYLF